MTVTVFLPEREVLRRLQKSRDTLKRWIATGDFPEPRQLARRSLGWVEAEVEAWMQTRPSGSFPQHDWLRAGGHDNTDHAAIA